MTAIEIALQFSRLLAPVKIDEFIEKLVSATSLTVTVNKHFKNQVDKDIIDKLDVAVGLKELLVNC
ncbi:MAG: hypothetical protein WA364_01710 [Candidatus Nitrosopolaris sp.]